MSWILRALPLALLACSLPFACTTDDVEDGTAGETGSQNDTTASASNATADETASGDDSAVLGCAVDFQQENDFDTTSGMNNPLMQTWGAACTNNQECVDLLGDPDAICDFMAVIYELPGGYCTKPCTLPDANTLAVPDDPQCDPAGGVTCLGVKGTFERCALECTDDNQCNRDGYLCRQLPLVSEMDDPSFCLMPDCCQESCVKG